MLHSVPITSAVTAARQNGVFPGIPTGLKPKSADHRAESLFSIVKTNSRHVGSAAMVPSYTFQKFDLCFSPRFHRDFLVPSFLIIMQMLSFRLLSLVHTDGNVRYRWYFERYAS
jgi:hypothetical protein